MVETYARILNIVRWTNICLCGLCISLVVYWLVFLFVVVGLASMHLDLGRYLGIGIPVIAGIFSGVKVARKVSAKVFAYSATVNVILICIFGAISYAVVLFSIWAETH